MFNLFSHFFVRFVLDIAATIFIVRIHFVVYHAQEIIHMRDWCLESGCSFRQLLALDSKGYHHGLEQSKSLP